MVERRFTVIAGGADAGGTSEDASWRIDLHRPGQVPPEAVAAWRALLARTGTPDPVFSDPDYLQAAAQHRAGGSEVVFALAWSGAEGTGSLRGALALTVPHPVWGRGRFVPWQPPGPASASAVEARFASELAVVLADHLKVLRWNASLDLGPDTPRGVSARPALGAVSAPPCIPAGALVDVGGAGAAVRQRIREPEGIRDAVEEFLALDAAHAAAPIIADPSEASFVRVVMRLFARRRLAAVDLTRRNGRVTAAALRLGAGPQAVTWRRAQAGLDAARRRSA